MPVGGRELVNIFSKDIKIVANRIVEVEFSWLQRNPYQNYRLKIDEQRFVQSQKQIRSKKLISMKFEQFIHLISSILANEAVEISSFVLRSTFDQLFDQNSNNLIEQDEFDSLYILLHGLNNYNQTLLHENMRQLLGYRSNHISFKDFHEFVRCGYLRDLLMT